MQNAEKINNVLNEEIGNDMASFQLGNIKIPDEIKEKKNWVGNTSLQSTQFGSDMSYSKNSFNISQQSNEDKQNDPCKYPGNLLKQNISNNPQIQSPGLFPAIPNDMYQTSEFQKQKIIDACKDSKTTIILQKAIMKAKNEVIVFVVNELKGEYRRLINDKNGNYFCSDLFKICEQEQRIIILKELSPFLSEDCVSNFATHPIQSLIEFSSCEDEYKLILFNFNDYNKLLSASLDPNGSYVIQKIIERIPERFRQDFNYIFLSFIGFVSKQKFGVVAVKRFIYCTKNEDSLKKILEIIKANFMSLALDKYGNYLIQYLLDIWANFQEVQTIKNLIIDNFQALAQNKFSSFICELLIKNMSEEEKNELKGTLDIGEIQISNNPYEIKVMNLLGITNNNSNANNNNINNNNIINNFGNPSLFSLFSNLNNNTMQNNNLQPNFVNFGNFYNNFDPINFGNNNKGETLNKNKKNNKKNKNKKNNK